MNANTIKKTYPVLGMTCGACANSSQKILQRQNGVVSASVNFATGTANIEYDSSLTNISKLKQALQAVGFDLDTDESEQAAEHLAQRERQHYQSQKKKTLYAAIFSLPLAIIAMVPVLMHMPYANYIMWFLATPVVTIFGKDFFIRAYKKIKHLEFNMDTLVALSAGTAYIYSIFNTVYPQFWVQRGLHPDVYFEAAAVVITFVLLGKLLEEKAKSNTSSSIKKLIGLQPKTVVKVNDDGSQTTIPISTLAINDVILVKPGDKIAVDGIVTDGYSFVDESMITGEPIAVEKKLNDKVFAGTINQRNSFQFKAQKVGSDTLLAQIIRMVQEAQGSKAPVQKLVDKIASIFVPVVIGIAILSFIIWMILGQENAFTHALLAFITVLVIACPCALGLATPTAIMVGIGKGAENGILIKDAESLETIQKVSAIAMDKTGTITEGKPEVTSIKWFVNNDSKYIDIVYSIEKSSEHPLADAVCIALEKSGKVIKEIQIESIVGKGVIGIYNGKKYFVGNESLLNDNKIGINTDTRDWIDKKLSQAKTIVLFASQDQVIAGIAIADKIKDSSITAVRELQEQGIAIYMLTGDNEHTAKEIAKEAGVEHYKAAMLPTDKTAFIKDLQNRGQIVAMTGDGINDSAALAQANVGIAMGKGSDIAIDTAKMTIISNDLSKIPQAIKLSRQTNRTIKENLFWAFIYNLIAIPIAAGILYPFDGFLLNPMFAGAAMALSSISVVTNSIILKYKKL